MQVLNDYSHIRGVCHNPHPEDGPERLEREMGYCQRLQLDSVRSWMSMEAWEQQGDRYFDMLDQFMRTAWRFGVSSMPIFWNGNFIREWNDPDEAWYARAEDYARTFIERFRDEPFILMWERRTCVPRRPGGRRCPAGGADDAVHAEAQDHRRYS